MSAAVQDTRRYVLTPRRLAISRPGCIIQLVPFRNQLTLQPANSLSGSLPPALARLLAAGAPAERDDAWSAFVAAFTGAMLRVCRSIGGDHDAVMDRYAFVLDQLRGRPRWC